MQKKTIFSEVISFFATCARGGDDLVRVGWQKIKHGDDLVWVGWPISRAN